jgi:hypothetical protein
MVGTLGFDPSPEQSSTAKEFISLSCVQHPPPLLTYYINFIEDAILNLEEASFFLRRLSQQSALPNT